MVQVELIPDEIADDFEIEIEIRVGKRHDWRDNGARQTVSVVGPLRTLATMAASGLGATAQGMIEASMNQRIAQALIEAAAVTDEDGEDGETVA